jgi:hypothetical protein
MSSRPTSSNSLVGPMALAIGGNDDHVAWRARRDAVVTRVYRQYGPWTPTTVHADELLYALTSQLADEQRVSARTKPRLVMSDRRECRALEWVDHDANIAATARIPVKPWPADSVEAAVQEIIENLADYNVEEAGG